jgi:hypothetical protein
MQWFPRASNSATLSDSLLRYGRFTQGTVSFQTSGLASISKYQACSVYWTSRSQADSELLWSGSFAAAAPKAPHHRDRLCRFGFDLVKHILHRHGAVVEVLQDPQVGAPCNDSPVNELADDLLAIVTVFAARHHGRRRNRVVVSPDGGGGDDTDSMSQGEGVPDT